MSLDVLVIENKLRDYRVPEELISHIAWAMRMRILLADEVERLKERIQQIKQHVPAEIANPPAPEIVTRRRSQWD